MLLGAFRHEYNDETIKAILGRFAKACKKSSCLQCLGKQVTLYFYSHPCGTRTETAHLIQQKTELAVPFWEKDKTVQ